MCDKSILLILAILVTSNTFYGLAAPFLPTLLEDLDIAETLTGLIFSAYAIASMIMSLFVGKIIDRAGHRCIITLGALLMSTSIFCFGLVHRLSDKLAIVLLFLLLRCGQGIASGMINTSAFAYAAEAYP